MRRFRSSEISEKTHPPTGSVPHMFAEEIFIDSVRLCTQYQMPNLSALRQRLISRLKDFQQRETDAGREQPQIDTASYALCTLLDETIGDTCWGSGVWGSNSLLMHFYGESHGGERFFSLLEEVEKTDNESLLKVFYLCLALGLEGRYRLLPDGEAQLTIIRQRLTQRLQPRNVPPQTVWHRVCSCIKGRRGWICGGMLLLMVTCLAQFYLLSAAKRQHQRLQTLTLVAQEHSLVQKVASLLATDIHRGALELSSEGHGVRIILNSGAFFASGSTEISPQQWDVLQRLGANLRTLPVQVRIVGHSDNVSAGRKWRSNHALSLARAQTVKYALSPPEAGLPFSISVEGRGSDEPLTANDNADNRARNRRVEIYITPQD
jgi:type VI secretion system protein ImpK